MRFYPYLFLLLGCTNAPNSKSGIIDLANSHNHLKSNDSTPIIKLAIAKKKWIDTEERFTDSLGRVVSIYNSYPRGGGYQHSNQQDGYRIFWTSIVNESATPLKLTVAFPVDSFPTFTSPTAYIKALVPPNTMSMEKLEQFDFGVTNIKSLLDHGFKKPSTLQVTVNPNEEYFYHTLFLFHESEGRTRSALVLKGQELFYRISIDSYPPLLIPCGRIEFIQ